MERNWIDAFLFDLDGTLVDSFDAIAASVNAVRTAHGLAPLDESAIRKFVGRGLDLLLENTIGDGDMEANKRLYLEHHPSVIATHTRLLDGVRETLPVIHQSFKTAVCSNKPLSMTKILLAETGMADWFDAALGPESVARKKPAPDMLLEAARLLKVEPARCIYIGDMTIDIEAARAAGVTCWAISTGVHDAAALAAAAPDRLFERFEEIAAIPHRVPTAARLK